MSKYIDAEKLKAEIERLKSVLTDPLCSQDNILGPDWVAGGNKMLNKISSVIDSLQQEQDRLRYCIEYINPQYPLLDNGELNIRHLRVPDEHGAEMALTLMLSLGAKIYALYRGNVKKGKLAEWPTPTIVDTDDWYSIDWLHNILDCGCTL